MITFSNTRDESGSDQAQVIKVVIPDSDYMALDDEQVMILGAVLDDLRDLVGALNG